MQALRLGLCGLPALCFAQHCCAALCKLTARPAPAATNGQVYGNGTTLDDQTDYYKLVYTYAESSIDNGGALKGVSFWRWNAISGQSDLDAQDAALTLSEPSCMPPPHTPPPPPGIWTCSRALTAWLVHGC